MKTKYKVGEQVRIVDHWDPHGACMENREGKMDKYLGTVMTIMSVVGDIYEMEEDKVDRYGRGWMWNDACIAGYADDDIDQKEFVALL